MKNSSIVELEAQRIRFFSRNDEKAFFEWLDKLICVEKYAGQGDVLYISVIELLWMKKPCVTFWLFFIATVSMLGNCAYLIATRFLHGSETLAHTGLVLCLVKMKSDLM